MRQVLSCILIFFSLVLSANPLIGQNADTIRVYFETDQFQIQDPTLISEKFKGLDLGDLLEIEVIGYADPSGSIEYNKLIAEKRANSASDVLKSSMDLSGLKLTIKGTPLLDIPQSEWKKARKVDVILYKKLQVNPLTEPSNELEVTATENMFTHNSYAVDSLVEKSIVLEGLSFIPGRHFPTPESLPALEKLLNTMRRYPKLVIEIAGHICCFYEGPDGMDNDTGEYSLSRNRAKFVHDYLLENGISAERLSYKGLGSSDPKVFPEMTEFDRQLNRRVEINVVSN